MATYGLFRCKITGIKGSRKKYYLGEILTDRGKGRKVEIVVNRFSYNWGIGEEKTFFGKVEIHGKYGDRYVITPLSKEEAVEVSKHIFYDQDAVLLSNPNMCNDDMFVDDYLIYAEIIGKEDMAKNRLKRAREIISGNK